MNDKDYLDDLIESSSQDPEFSNAFAQAWTEIEARETLVSLRKAAGLTQLQVADRMGVSQPRVVYIERQPYSVSFGRIIAYLRAIGAEPTFQLPRR